MNNKIIFQTEDGFNIYNGDSFYYYDSKKGCLSDERIAKQENTPNPSNPKFKKKDNALKFVNHLLEILNDK